MKLTVGTSYHVRAKDGAWTAGEYLGSRIILGQTFIVLREVMAHCRGEDGCWRRRNIALDQVVEITPESDDLTCARLWCTD